MDVARCRDAHPTLKHRTQVSDDVPEHIGRHYHVEPLGVLDHPHAAGVDVSMIGLDVGEICRDLGEGPGPDVLWP